MSHLAGSVRSRCASGIHRLLDEVAVSNPLGLISHLDLGCVNEVGVVHSQSL